MYCNWSANQHQLLTLHHVENIDYDNIYKLSLKIITRMQLSPNYSDHLFAHLLIAG